MGTETLLTPDKDVLTVHRNNFQKQLIEAVLDLKRHEIIKKEDPTFQRKNPQTGKYTGIDEIMETLRKAAVNAKAYVEIIDELLAINEQGLLQTTWENVHEIPSPFSGNDQEKKDEAVEGEKVAQAIEEPVDEPTEEDTKE